MKGTLSAPSVRDFLQRLESRSLARSQPKIIADVQSWKVSLSHGLICLDPARLAVLQSTRGRLRTGL